jgi:hypothetical protein
MAGFRAAAARAGRWFPGFFLSNWGATSGSERTALSDGLKNTYAIIEAESPARYGFWKQSSKFGITFEWIHLENNMFLGMRIKGFPAQVFAS